MLLKNIYTHLLNNLSNELWAKYYNFRHKNKKIFHLHYDSETMNFVIKDKTIGKLYFNKRSRIGLFEKGVSNRLEKLASSYMLDHVSFVDNDTIVDCGANIGEIGMFFAYRDPKIRYHAFEPSLEEFKCCTINNINGVVNDTGLWKSEGSLDFYEKNNTADSSLFLTKDYDCIRKVNVTTLNDYCKKHSIDFIKLLKLEAEGAEPEILLGASNIISKIQYIAADVSPERGINQESTLCDVVNYLFENKFELIQSNNFRLLFKNKRY